MIFHLWSNFLCHVFDENQKLLSWVDMGKALKKSCLWSRKIIKNISDHVGYHYQKVFNKVNHDPGSFYECQMKRRGKLNHIY